MIDCEQSLFFFIFSEGSARARESRARREKRGLLPEKKKERFSVFVPLPSRTLSNPRGHLRVSSVLLDGPRKKRDCS